MTDEKVKKKERSSFFFAAVFLFEGYSIYQWMSKSI